MIPECFKYLGLFEPALTNYFNVTSSLDNPQKILPWEQWDAFDHLGWAGEDGVYCIDELADDLPDDPECPVPELSLGSQFEEPGEEPVRCWCQLIKEIFDTPKS